MAEPAIATAKQASARLKQSRAQARATHMREISASQGQRIDSGLIERSDAVESAKGNRPTGFARADEAAPGLGRADRPKQTKVTASGYEKRLDKERQAVSRISPAEYEDEDEGGIAATLRSNQQAQRTQGKRAGIRKGASEAAEQAKSALREIEENRDQINQQLDKVALTSLTSTLFLDPIAHTWFAAKLYWGKIATKGNSRYFAPPTWKSWGIPLLPDFMLQSGIFAAHLAIIVVFVPMMIAQFILMMLFISFLIDPLGTAKTVYTFLGDIPTVLLGVVDVPVGAITSSVKNAVTQ